MVEKNLKTRIINKHASLSEWGSSTLVLKEGEIALAYVQTTKPDGNGGTYTVPTYLMKVGDGTNTFANLNWLAAPASDVYAWAKNEKLAYADMPDEVKNISGNAQAAIEAAIAELKNSDAEVTNQFVTAAVQENGVVTVTRRALAAADIPSLSADKITEGTFADARIESASKWNAAATQAETNKSNLEAEVTARQNTDSRVTALENTIQGLSGAMHFVGESTTDPTGESGATITGHTTFSAGDVCLFGDKEYVYNGTEWIELGDEGSHLTRDEANQKFETIANCDAIRTNVTNLQSDVSGLKTTVGDGTSGLVKDVVDLKTLTTTHTSDIATNARQIATNKTDIGTLQSDLAALTTEVGKKALATDLTAAVGRITSLETSVGTNDTTGLRKRVVDLEGTVGSATSGLVKDVADLKTNKADASTVTALNTKLQTGTFISSTNQFVAYNGDELILDCGGIE